MTPREVLLKAAELVERGWCQGHGATDKSGNTVDRDADDAACFCALGAISRATQGTKQSVRNDLFWDARARLGDVVDQAGFMGVAPWNDAPGRTQAEVVQALRQAAEACE